MASVNEKEISFFFFKQKTAYEIGTGDWSSDVCSSDLIERVFDLDWVMPWDFGLSELSTEDQKTEPSDAQQIGRASCRERV